MKLAASNIAWQPDEAQAAYAVLAEGGATGLEIAPGLAFAGEDDPVAIDDAAIARFRADVRGFGLAVVSMQSLLFGVQGAQLFGTLDETARFEGALMRAITLANRMEVPNLVFGSPGNRRYPDDVGAEDAQARATAIFRRLGDSARAAGTVLAIEPNPVGYGTNFLTTVADAAAFVRSVDHPAITLNLDLGAAHMNGEIEEVPCIHRDTAASVSHVHISEPQLAPAPADGDRFERLAATLMSQGFDRWFSIEMRAPHGDAIDNLRACVARAATALTNAEATRHA